MQKFLKTLLLRLKYRIEVRIANTLDGASQLDTQCQFSQIGKDVNREIFKKSGIFIFKNAFTQIELDRYRRIIDKEIRNNRFEKNIDGQKYFMGNIGDISCGADIVSNDNLNLVLDVLIGGNQVFIGHDSVSINYSVPGLHDDQKSFRQLFGDEGSTDISTVRVLFNLNCDMSMPQRFGFVPGTHLRQGSAIDRSYCEANLKWIEVSHGTVIFFDPRLIHTADLFTHEKHMVVLTFDDDNNDIEQLFYHTNEKRGQGVSASSEIWQKLKGSSLTPSFLKK